MKKDELPEPPEVMKRRLRNILRQEREGRKITQKEAADRVLWSLSKVIRIENGVSPAAPADVRLLLMEYGAPTDRVAEVVDIAKAARQPDDWDEFKSIYSTASISLFANERAASLIQKYEPTLVPGLLQTEDYARALLTALGVDSATLEEQVRARMQRQELLDETERPRLDFIIGEATVSRPIGGPRVMRKQIEHMKTFARDERNTLRFMPFNRGAHPGLGSAFTILEFKDAELPDLVYLESADHDSIVRDDKADVRKYIERFSELESLAPGPEELDGYLDEVARYRFDDVS